MIKSIADYQNYIEAAIADYKLPDSPANLYDPIRYFINLGGKRMRPVLALMGTELFLSDYSNAKHAALAVELFHNFSLIHDDIMDEAPLRRGNQTVHTKWDENIAILSGDALLIEAYKQFSHYPPEIMAPLLALFNNTAIQVCEGQQWDMDFEKAEDVDINSYLKMIAYKTAVLLGCSLKMGAIIGGASDSDAQDLYDFGLNLGIAFQIQDDILDVYADQNKFGKQVGGDIIANKKTYLLLSAFEDADASQTNRLEQLLGETNPQVKVAGVKAVYAELLIKEKATDQMNALYETAMQKLDQLSIDKAKKRPLEDLARFLLGRES